MNTELQNVTIGDLKNIVGRGELFLDVLEILEDGEIVLDLPRPYSQLYAGRKLEKMSVCEQHSFESSHTVIDCETIRIDLGYCHHTQTIATWIDLDPIRNGKDDQNQHLIIFN